MNKTLSFEHRMKQISLFFIHLFNTHFIRNCNVNICQFSPKIHVHRNQFVAHATNECNEQKILTENQNWNRRKFSISIPLLNLNMYYKRNVNVEFWINHHFVLSSMWIPFRSNLELFIYRVFRVFFLSNFANVGRIVASGQFELCYHATGIWHSWLFHPATYLGTKWLLKLFAELSKKKLCLILSANFEFQQSIRQQYLSLVIFHRIHFWYISNGRNQEMECKSFPLCQSNKFNECYYSNHLMDLIFNFSHIFNYNSAKMLQVNFNSPAFNVRALSIIVIIISKVYKMKRKFNIYRILLLLPFIGHWNGNEGGTNWNYFFFVGTFIQQLSIKGILLWLLYGIFRWNVNLLKSAKSWIQIFTIQKYQSPQNTI